MSTQNDAANVRCTGLVRRLVQLEEEYAELVAKRDALPLTVMKLAPWYEVQAQIDGCCGMMMRTERSIIKLLVAQERTECPHNEGGETVPSSSPRADEGKVPTTAPDCAQAAAPVNPGGSGIARQDYLALAADALNARQVIRELLHSLRNPGFMAHAEKRAKQLMATAMPSLGEDAPNKDYPTPVA